jgi:hypothetical protein
MKRIWTAIGLLIILFGCSEKEIEKEPKFTVKEAIENNHVVIQNLSDKERELMTGSTKTEHLLPMFSFLKDVETNKESTLEVTVFQKSGEPVTSTLHFVEKEKTIFKNNYSGYGMPKGEFECMNVFESRTSLSLNGCKGELSNIFVIPFESRDYMIARNEYRKINKE